MAKNGLLQFNNVSTHSHPKVAAKAMLDLGVLSQVSTHSHPKVAAELAYQRRETAIVSTHSHPKVAAYPNNNNLMLLQQFQHTATRRWLLPISKFTC